MIGVWDSGVGGLSVLRAIHSRLPAASLQYLADSSYAPYGDKTNDEVIERSKRVTSHLLAQGARMIVVACNTATTCAIAALRAQWPAVPFVGVEPGIKPAVARTRNGRIGVLATRRTVASERLQRLIADHANGATVTLQACPGLVDAIESGTLDDAALRELLDGFCSPLRAAHVDTVVLGCTHYPFVASHIQALMGPDVQLIDTAEAVAQRVMSVWEAQGLRLQQGKLSLQTSGNAATLERFAQHWLHWHVPAAHVDL